MHGTPSTCLPDFPEYVRLDLKSGHPAPIYLLFCLHTRLRRRHFVVYTSPTWTSLGSLLKVTISFHVVKSLRANRERKGGNV